jgi:hypothetical protein
MAGGEKSSSGAEFGSFAKLTRILTGRTDPAAYTWPGRSLYHRPQHGPGPPGGIRVGA